MTSREKLQHAFTAARNLKSADPERRAVLLANVRHWIGEKMPRQIKKMIENAEAP